jgi:hypothetical protein
MKIETIKKKMDELEKQSDEIEENVKEILQKTNLKYDSDLRLGNYSWDLPSEDVKIVQRKAVRLYQRWYTTSLHFIKEYLDKAREDEFIEFYPKIMYYLHPNWHSYSSNKDEFIDEFINKFDIQIGILSSIPDVIEVKEMNLRKLISADFVESELEEAEVLFNHKYIRGAGALAGVALEKHLKTICEINNVEYKFKDTIDPLATKLYTNDHLDKSEFKKIQYLASIRNKCDHPDEITREEVKELIEGAKKFIINH